MILAALSIVVLRTKVYAQAIFLNGTNRLTSREENGVTYPGVALGYYTPVEQYAATNYTLPQIENAFIQGWISQQEHDETIALIATA